MPYDPQRHQRRSIRKKQHDYSAPGAYYVTICVQKRKRILSRIQAGQVELLEAGAIVEGTWRRLAQHFDHITLDAWIIMPDHIHGIIVLVGETSRTLKAATEQAQGTKPGSLAAIVQNFKSVSARRINQARGTPGQRVWQEDYYEHIVRDTGDMDRIRAYIAANPSQWHNHR